MPSMMNSYRMRSLFAPPKGPQVNLPKRFVSNMMDPPDWSVPQDAQETDDAMSYYKDLEKLRNDAKAGPARSAYMQALTEQPMAQQYEPSRGRRIGASIIGALTGFGEGPSRGGKAAEDFLDAPYQEALRDYKTRIAGLQQSAEMEQKDFTDRGKNIEQAARLGLDYKKFKGEMTDKELQRRLTMRGQDLTAGSRSAATEELRGYHTGVLSNQRDTLAETKRYHGQEIGVQQYNALTARQKAQADAETDNYNAITRRGVGMSQIRKNDRPDVLHPGEQQKAVDNALREMYQDPRFSQFVDKNTQTGLYDYKEVPEWQLNSEVYREFRKRMSNSIKRSMGEGFPYPNYFGENEDDDGSIVIGPPIPGRR